MLRKERQQTGSHVLLTLVFDKPTVQSIDDAARILGIDRQEVLRRGFEMLSVAASVMYGHADHAQLVGA